LKSPSRPSLMSQSLDCTKFVVKCKLLLSMRAFVLSKYCFLAPARQHEEQSVKNLKKQNEIKFFEHFFFLPDLLSFYAHLVTFLLLRCFSFSAQNIFHPFDLLESAAFHLAVSSKMNCRRSTANCPREWEISWRVD
jgi:hypothetical protein